MPSKQQRSMLVAQKLCELGFPEEFARTIAEYTNTEYTCARMLKYLDSARPNDAGIVAEEMLIILAERDKIREKKINDRRIKPVNEKYIRSIRIDHASPGFMDSYAARIPALQSLTELSFEKNITFFCGENGSGKSTLLEAIAIACGLNPEGGTWNYSFRTYDDFSGLYSAVKLIRGTHRPKWSYFLRAETFYNAATAAVTEYNLKDYHAQSHGESFLGFIMDNKATGLYLMDEPEAALSPQHQLELLLFLERMAGNGSQFIIATHSPILLGAPSAGIYSFDGDVHPVKYEETESYRITSMFVNNRERFLRELLRAGE